MEEIVLESNGTLNTSKLLEESRNINPNILKLYQLNRKVDGWAFYSLIVAYTFLILLGTFGNMLVVYVIVVKPSMRTVRNLFILNLAVSDLLLCLITMPLTLMEILTRYWPLGHNSFFCKIIGTLEAISIFVSTFSITAIALDRYQVIVYPMRDSVHRFGAIIILGGIWLLSIVLASPMYFCRRLDILQDINFTQIGLDSLAYCLEDWTFPHGRALYSIFVLIIQYVVPIVIVSVAYSRICKKLQYRYVSTTVLKRENEVSRRKSREVRRRKTNSLFIAIALVYCISWLPLNLCNVIYDATNPFGEDFHTTIVVFAICHMMGMSSACSNPFLYGWLNDNFRKEFKGPEPGKPPDRNLSGPPLLKPVHTSEIIPVACPCLRRALSEDCRLLKCKPPKRKMDSRCFDSNSGKTTKGETSIGGSSIFTRQQKQKAEDEYSTQEMSTKITEIVTASVGNGSESNFKTETL